MKAECTWGDGPDILITIDNNLLIRTGNGAREIVRDGQIDLTISEAESLLSRLSQAIDTWYELEDYWRYSGGTDR